MASDSVSGSDNTNELFSAEFEVVGKVPGELFNQFLETQVNLFGLRGWVQETDEGAVKGHIEGQRPSMDNLKDAIKTAEQFADKVTDVVFDKLTKIDDYTFTNFEVK